MMRVAASIAIVSVALLGAAGCEEPGVTSVTAVMGTGGSSPAASAAGKPAAAATAGAGAPMAPPAPPPAGVGAMVPPLTASAGTSAAGAPAAGSLAAGSLAAGSSAAGASAAASPVAGASAAAGSGAGSVAGATGAPGAGGSASPAAPGPCPTGYTCTDLAALGLTAKTQDGAEITASCGNGAPVDCNDATPAASCAPLTAPFCAHLEVAGSMIVSCGQHCTP